MRHVSLLLRNARQPGGGPVDVLIDDGRVAAMGYGLPAGVAEIIDLAGRYILPGLWDNHVHLTQHALARRRVDVSVAASAAQAARIMADHFLVQPPEPGVALIGYGFQDGLWPDVPTRDLLDAAIARVPVILLGHDLHCCWMNSVALAQFGFGDHPTGLLREDDCFHVAAAVHSVPATLLDRWIAEAATAAAARGVVGVVEFEMAPNLDTWRSRFAAGFDTLRIAAGIYTQQLDNVIAAGYRTGDAVDGTHGLLTIGPYKVIIDGTLNTRTAFCIDSYPGIEDQPGARGILTVTPHELVPLLRASAAAGLLPAVHAIGDEAGRLALNAFEVVGCAGRIEHAQLLREADFTRFARLGVVASVQPEHAMDDREIADRYWTGRTGRAFALRSLLEAGAELIFGSDAPVAPLDPWITAAAAVSRSRDGREPWHPEQTISIEQALAASTNRFGRIAVGATADLAIVDEDPLAVTADRLRRMSVSGTLLAGRWTHNTL